MPTKKSTATVQSIWDDGKDDIPSDVLDLMAYNGRIWVLAEPIRPFRPEPMDGQFRYYEREIKRAEYRAVDMGDGRNFGIEGRFGGVSFDWERVGHIQKS